MLNKEVFKCIAISIYLHALGFLLGLYKWLNQNLNYLIKIVLYRPSIT